MKTTAKDLTGKRFGNLIAICPTNERRRSNVVWKCQCDCGKVTYVTCTCLVRGSIRSCGCLVKSVWQKIGRKAGNDITGRRFGRLIVLEKTDKRSKNGNIIWKVKCDCGKEFEVISSSLLNNRTQSCGCLKQDIQRTLKTKHGQSRTVLYANFQCRKRHERKIILDSAWTLEMNLALKQFQSRCVVCNSENKLTVDHVLPLSKGYGLKPGNAVVLCRYHNSKKHTKNLSQLPSDQRLKITHAAKHFECYWDSLNEKTWFSHQ